MSNKIHIIKHLAAKYLSVVTILSTGVLSGCEYCIPLLVMSLALPFILYITNRTDVLFETSPLAGGAL